MATPIKPTPLLKGKSSERFNRLLASNKKATKEVKERISSIVKKVLSNK
ncbi:MAG: hypothetical protein H0V01_14680 [Bacteroidetes bacterium]|nr:hypothetical protein [Bacteroidota bacterium]HET6242929.1 hypothetical protein [Bacteroidia bacterium]